MKITFLGVTSMHPTEDRAQMGIFIQHGTEKILLDCGESVQRQMRIKGIAPPRITRLFITHLHNDHILGFPGLYENLSHARGEGEFDRDLFIYGPKGVKKKFEAIINAFDMRNPLKIKYIEIGKNGKFLDTPEIECYAQFLKHSSTCIGYKIKEKDRKVMDLKYIKKMKLPKGPILGKLQKGSDVVFKGKKIKSKDATLIKKGKSISFVLDTLYCDDCIKIAKDSDLLVVESTVLKELESKAKLYKHMTSEQAGKVAGKAKVGKVVLTHFSQRHNKNDLKKMKKEAEKYHKKVLISEDFMDVEV